MNTRFALYLAAHALHGNALAWRYHEFVRDDAAGCPREAASDRLRDILVHATTHVPYYRDLAAGIGSYDPTDDPYDYLAQLPVLTKAVVRDRAADLVSDDIGRRRWQYNSSGGSTGEPVRLVQDRDYTSRVVAAQLVFSRWLGREVGEPEVHVWGSERDIIDGTRSGSLRWANALTRKDYLNAFRMTPDTMREWLAGIDRRPPHLVVGYAAALYQLARFIDEQGLQIRAPRRIVSTAGPLYEFIRRAVEDAFGAPVTNLYGSRETGNIAAECPAAEGMHVFPWINHVEVIDDAGQPLPPGEDGHIVVTSLANRAMPLLRYAIGDRGRLGYEAECPCGRQTQMLESVTGRMDDVFESPDGTLVDG